MFQLVPGAYCIITVHLGGKLAPSHEQTHQRYKLGTSKGGALLVNPYFMSQTETGSRYQKYFLNKWIDLFAMGNIYSCRRSMAGWWWQVTCLFCVAGHHHLPKHVFRQVHLQLSKCCKRPLILMEQSIFFKQHNIFRTVSFCSIISSSPLLSYHTERPACILKCTLIWSNQHLNYCIILARSVNNKPHMLQTWSHFLISLVKNERVRRGIRL